MFLLWIIGLIYLFIGSAWTVFVFRTVKPESKVDALIGIICNVLFWPLIMAYASIYFDK